MRLISLSLLSWPVPPGHDTNHPQRIQRDRSAGLRKQCPPRTAGHKEVVLRSFAGLCFLLPLAGLPLKFSSRGWSNTRSLSLQIRLSKKIAGAPLCVFLEEHGTHRLLSVLIQDIDAFDHALANIPVSCLNLTVVASGLVYLGWLSRTVFVIALGFSVLCLRSLSVPGILGGKGSTAGAASRRWLLSSFQLAHGRRQRT